MCQFVAVILLIGLLSAYVVEFLFFSSRIRHTWCALVTGVQTCALPICDVVHLVAGVLDPHLLQAELLRLGAQPDAVVRVTADEAKVVVAEAKHGTVVDDAAGLGAHGRVHDLPAGQSADVTREGSADVRREGNEVGRRFEYGWSPL